MAISSSCPTGGLWGLTLKLCCYHLLLQQYLSVQATDESMWYLKNVWNASKNLIDQRTPAQKLIDTIAESQQQILPTNKLSQLSAMTYQVDQFDQIVTILFEKLKKFHYDLAESHKTLNILVATNYIIKHGATGFVDEFRKYVYMFKKYESLEAKKTYEDTLTQAQLDANLEKIKSRAHHISELLSNKEKLLKQKQLSMLVKQKLKLYQKSKMSSLQNESYSNEKERKQAKMNKKAQVEEAAESKIQSTVKNIGSRAQQIFKRPEDLSIKLEGLLQTYVWKYVDKLDETIESASDKVMQQIDRYMLGKHDDFELDENQQGEEGKESKKQKNEEKDDDVELMKRLEEEALPHQQVQHADLLQFEEVKPTVPEKKQPVEDLL